MKNDIILSESQLTFPEYWRNLLRSFLGARGRRRRQFCAASSARPMAVSPCGGSGTAISVAENKPEPWRRMFTLTKNQFQSPKPGLGSFSVLSRGRSLIPKCSAKYCSVKSSQS